MEKSYNLCSTQNSKNRNFMQGSPIYRELGFIIKSVLLIEYPDHLVYGNIVWGNNYKTKFKRK